MRSSMALDGSTAEPGSTTGGAMGLLMAAVTAAGTASGAASGVFPALASATGSDGAVGSAAGDSVSSLGLSGLLGSGLSNFCMCDHALRPTVMIRSGAGAPGSLVRILNRTVSTLLGLAAED